MAIRRCISKKIISTSTFLSMSLSAQALYLHLNLNADDEGVIDNVRPIMRMIGANEDDIKILLSKQYLLVIEDEVIVVRDWWVHNTLQKDRFEKSLYNEKLNTIYCVDNNKQYTSNDNKMITNCYQNDNTSKDKISQDKLIKDNLIKNIDISKDISMSDKSDDIYSTEYIKNLFNSICISYSPIAKITKDSKRYKSYIARVKEYGIEKVKQVLENAEKSSFLKGQSNSTFIADFEWLMRPNNFAKVLENKYVDRFVKSLEERKIEAFEESNRINNEKLEYSKEQKAKKEEHKIDPEILEKFFNNKPPEELPIGTVTFRKNPLYREDA